MRARAISLVWRHSAGADHPEPPDRDKGAIAV